MASLYSKILDGENLSKRFESYVYWRMMQLHQRRKAKELKVVVLFVVLSIFGFPSVGQAVTYGTPVLNASTAFPEVVSVWYDSEGTGQSDKAEFICTATLIEQQVAVTAAHCIQGFSGGDWYVEVGADELGKGERHAVDAVWFNPRYSKTRIANDIGVLHIQGFTNLSNYAAIAKVGTVKKTSKMLIAGWGVDQNGDLGNRLQKLTVKVDNTRAIKSFGSQFNPATTLAAGRYFPGERVYGGACTGDSGGPLFLGVEKGRRQLVGIVSYGIKGCDEDAPTIFARTDYYAKIIRTGVKAAKSLAKTNNLAKPGYYKAPVLSGEPLVDSVLACTQGEWTSNATKFETKWVADIGDSAWWSSISARALGVGATYTVKAEDEGQTIFCVVTATNEMADRAGTTSMSTAVAPGALSASFTIDGKYKIISIWDVVVTASTTRASHLSKWCFFLDSVKTTEAQFSYGSGQMPYDSDPDGCASYATYDKLTSGTISFEFSGLTAGAHTLYAVVTDALGRSVTTTTVSFIK